MTPLRLILALMVTVALAPTVSAHSIKDLETNLAGKEKFFQPIDKAAPGFTLRNADGNTVRLADLRGKVAVLHFIYATCPDVCPLHADRIAELQAMVNKTPMKEQVQFISVTTDPVNDAAQVLRDYGSAHGLDSVNWTFLTTTPEQPEDTTRKLAESFGHKFTKTDDGYQMHGVVTHVIDKEGLWRANFHGLNFEPVNLVMFVNALVNDATAPHGHRDQTLWEKVKAWVK